VRIIHFSDIHLGRPSFRPSSLFDKRLLGSVNYILRRRGEVDEDAVQRLREKVPALKPDVIVCSGDITCVGSPQEFAAAQTALTPFTTLNSCPFLYVPGNHDAYVSRRSCVQALADTYEALCPSASGLLSRGFSELELHGISIGMLALAHPTNLFLSSGTLTDAAVEELDQWCRKGKKQHFPRVLIGHFPTRQADGGELGFRRHLRGRQQIADRLGNGDINLYLCGHIHSPFIHTLPGGSVECCTGSLTMKNVFSIIDIDLEGNVKHRYEKL